MVPLSKLADPDVRNLLYTLGVRGLATSAVTSLRTTESPDSFLLHPNVITDISPDATFDIQSHFVMGLKNNGATHPELARSNLTIQPDAEFRVTHAEKYASFAPGSVLTVAGEFSMGGGSYFNADARVICEDRIEIGDDCAIAWDVDILDTDRHRLTDSATDYSRTEPVIIGDHVWVGNNATVKKGVTIGDGAVIASDSTVTSDIPPNTLAAGSPAEVIREDVSWRH